MYAYTFDPISGGIILTDDDTKQFSKEPRPVYAREMDLLEWIKYGGMINKMKHPICGRNRVFIHTGDLR